MTQNNPAFGKSLELQVKVSLDELIRVATEIEAYGEQHSWPTKWITSTNLALDELITNIVNYAYEEPDTAPDIRLILTESEDQLTIVLEDQGIPFNPFHEAPKPSLEDELDERRIGGLGIHFVTTLMDETAYERLNNTNRVILTLHRA